MDNHTRAARRGGAMRATRALSRPALGLLVGALLGGAPFAGQAARAQCELEPPIIGNTVETPGLTWNAATDHRYVFVADDFIGGVHIIDVENPVGPVLLATVDIPGSPLDLAADDKFLYVAAGFGGVQVIDVSTPADPKLVGGTITPGYARSVAVAGGHVYVASSFTALCGENCLNGGVQVLDCRSAPTCQIRAKTSFIGANGPVQVTGGTNPGTALGIDVAGDYLYVADGHWGLSIFRIYHEISPDGEPTYLQQIGGTVVDPTTGLPKSTGGPDVVFPLPGVARDVAVSGTFALVANGAAGLQVIDISDPLAPSIVRTVDTPGDARSISLLGRNAFIADTEGGLQVVDITDPANATLVSSVGAPLELAMGVEVAGRNAYVADLDKGLQVARAFTLDPPNASVIGGVDTTGDALAIDISGNIAYVADGAPPNGGLKVFDITDPFTPVQIGALATPSLETVVDVVAYGNYVYLTDWQPLDSTAGGLRVVDVSDPTAPLLVGTIPTLGDAMGVAVAGEFAYVADGFSGMSSWDVNLPDFPQFEVIVSHPDFATDVTVYGNLAYATNGFAGLGLHVLSSLRGGARVLRMDTPGFASRVAVSQGHAYVADGAAGLQIVSVTEGAFLSGYDMQIVSNIPSGDFASDVTISGTLAFVADGTNGVQIIDISDVSLPSLVGTVDTPGIANGVRVDGDIAYVADGPAGLQVIRLCSATPTQPTITWATPPPTTVDSGADYFVEWTLSDFTGSATGIQVCVSQGVGPETCFPDPALTGPDGNYSYTLTAPTVTTATTLTVRARATDAGLGQTQSQSILVTVAPNPNAPIIAWVVQPPPTATGGVTPIPLSWRLENFLGPIVDHQVHFGISSVLGSSPALTGTNGTFNYTFPAAPNIGTFDSPSTFVYIVRALNNTQQVLSLPEFTDVTAGPNPPTVTWVTPPPASITSGGQFTVEWQLSNYVNPITAADVVWGATSIIGQNPGTSSGPTTFTATADVPIVGGPVTIFYTVTGENGIEFAFAPITAVQVLP